MNSFLTILTTTFITVNTLSPKHVQHTAWSRREYGSSRGRRIVHRHLPRIVNHNSSRRNRSRSRWHHVSLCAIHNVRFWLQAVKKSLQSVSRSCKVVLPSFQNLPASHGIYVRMLIAVQKLRHLFFIDHVLPRSSRILLSSTEVIFIGSAIDLFEIHKQLTLFFFFFSLSYRILFSKIGKVKKKKEKRKKLKKEILRHSRPGSLQSSTSYYMCEDEI